MNEKPLLDGINVLLSKDVLLELKKHEVPEHLLCVIKGDLMDEPVTIASGRTFDKASITKYFET